MKRFFTALSYTFGRNLGRVDRRIRVAASIVGLGVAAYLVLRTPLRGVGITIAVLSVMILGTAIVARCSITYMLGRNTMSAKEASDLQARGVRIADYRPGA